MIDAAFDSASFAFAVRVYYEDTDFSGVVYHARYLHFFERARTEALRECGVVHSVLLAREEPLCFAIRKMTTEWIAPARIDDMLTVRTRFLSAKGARLAMGQEISRGGEPVASAHVDAACMNLDGKPRRLPSDVAAAILSRCAP